MLVISVNAGRTVMLFVSSRSFLDPGLRRDDAEGGRDDAEGGRDDEEGGRDDEEGGRDEAEGGRDDSG